MEAFIPPEWSGVVLDFRTLLALNSRHSHETLAKELGYPMPDRVVSVCRIGDTWPPEDWARIKQAQKRYDQGICELTTGRVPGHFVLYETTRKVIATDRVPYFSLHGNGLDK